MKLRLTYVSGEEAYHMYHTQHRLSSPPSCVLSLVSDTPTLLLVALVLGSSAPAQSMAHGRDKPRAQSQQSPRAAVGHMRTESLSIIATVSTREEPRTQTHSLLVCRRCHTPRARPQRRVVFVALSHARLLDGWRTRAIPGSRPRCRIETRGAARTSHAAIASRVL